MSSVNAAPPAMNTTTPDTGSCSINPDSSTSAANPCRYLILWRSQPYFVSPSGYTVPTDTIHKLKKLPAELRIRIWKLLLPVQRLLDFQVMGDFLKCFASSQRVPAILHINTQSRLQGLKYYRLITRIPSPEVDGVCIINPKLRMQSFCTTTSI